MASDRSLPTYWFTIVAAATFGMFGLLGWHIYSSHRVGHALQAEHARGLRLTNAMYSQNLRLAHLCHLVVFDGVLSEVEKYWDTANQMDGHLAEIVAGSDRHQMESVARARWVNRGLRQRERDAMRMSAQGRQDEAAAMLQNARYRSLMSEFDETVDDLVDDLNTTFSRRLEIEGARDRTMLVGAFSIFLVAAAVWLVLAVRLRRWGAKLQVEMALRERAESQLGEAQKMEALGQLAAGVAHDFNNILTVILGFVDIARKAVGAARENALEKIGMAADQGTEVTSSLLTFSRRSEAEMGALELGELVQQTQVLLQGMLPATVRVLLESNPPGEEFWVWGNRARLQQVLVNLVLNARDAIPAGGDVTIRLGRIETSRKHGVPRICLEVADTGSGMAPEVKERIFEPFFTTKPRGQSTGLGLAIVAAIVGEHRGEIQVETEAGAGTCFTLSLPEFIVDDPEAETTSPVGSRPVWIFSADPYIAGFIASALARVGCRTQEFSLSDSAIGSARIEERPALVVMDAEERQARVPEYLRLLWNRAQQIPVLVLSSDGSELGEGTLEGPVMVLAKPFMVTELVALVTRLVGSDGIYDPGSSGR